MNQAKMLHHAMTNYTRHHPIPIDGPKLSAAYLVAIAGMIYLPRVFLVFAMIKAQKRAAQTTQPGRRPINPGNVVSMDGGPVDLGPGDLEVGPIEPQDLAQADLAEAGKTETAA